MRADWLGSESRKGERQLVDGAPSVSTQPHVWLLLVLPLGSAMASPRMGLGFGVGGGVSKRVGSGDWKSKKGAFDSTPKSSRVRSGSPLKGLP